MKFTFKAVFRSLPLIGPLVDCHFENHVETVKQVFITLLLSTAPFWLGAVIVFGTTQTDITFSAAFWSTVWNGELFMCATSLLAPIFWLALDDPPGARAFPSKIAHMVLIVLVVAFASVFFGLGLAKNYQRQPFTFHLSVCVFCIAVALLYLSTVYHSNRLPDASAAFRADEDGFLAEYRRHRQ